MFKVTMVSNEAEASFMVKDMPEAWKAIGPAISFDSGCNLHVEDVDTGEVVFLFQDGAIQHMECVALIGFLDMAYAVNPLMATFMALEVLDILAGA